MLNLPPFCSFTIFSIRAALRLWFHGPRTLTTKIRQTCKGQRFNVVTCTNTRGSSPSAIWSFSTVLCVIPDVFTLHFTKLNFQAIYCRIRSLSLLSALPGTSCSAYVQFKFDGIQETIWWHDFVLLITESDCISTTQDPNIVYPQITSFATWTNWFCDRNLSLAVSSKFCTTWVGCMPECKFWTSRIP